MSKRLKITGLLLVATMGMLWITRTTVSYSAICARCLARAKCGESRILGIAFGGYLRLLSRSEEATQSGSLLPPEGPEIYSEIFGRPCQHAFKRGGMGISSFGMIGCGSSPEEQAFSPRTTAIQALFRLYRRLEDKERALESYDCIDAELKAEAPLKESLAGLRFEPGSIRSHLDSFAELMNLVVTEDEWRRVNTFAKSDFPGNPPFLADADFLRERLSDRHPEIHRTASLKLMELPLPDRWSFVSKCLDDHDPEIARAAANHIVAYHRLELFGKLLRKPPEISGKYYIAASLPDTDINGLLDSDDPLIDELCFEAITRSHRFQFLAPLLVKLNRHATDKTLHAIRSLLDGPDVFDGEGDPWERITALEAPIAELKEIIGIGTASRVTDKRKWHFLEACKALAAGKDASLWDFLHSSYIREVSSGVNETYAAVMSKAMSELDSKRTNEFLLNEIKLDDFHRLTCAFAAMGLLGESMFLGPILEFKRQMPKPSPGNPYPPEYIFKNPAYARFLEYAVHRSRGIHLQSVQRGQNGVYVLVGP